MLFSYDKRIDKDFIAKTTGIVELNQAMSAYENNVFYSDEQILEMFNPTPWKRTLIKDYLF